MPWNAQCLIPASGLTYLWRSTLGVEIKNDTTNILGNTQVIALGQETILQRIGFLSSKLEDQDKGMMLRRYLNSLSSYAETVSQGSLVDPNENRPLTPSSSWVINDRDPRQENGESDATHNLPDSSVEEVSSMPEAATAAVNVTKSSGHGQRASKEARQTILIGHDSIVMRAKRDGGDLNAESASRSWQRGVRAQSPELVAAPSRDSSSSSGKVHLLNCFVWNTNYQQLSRAATAR